MDDYRLDSKRTLGLPKQVREIELGCFYMLVRDDTHAVIDIDGVMAEVVRQQPASKR